MKKTILITGANGKLGKVFVENFLRKDYLILATSRSTDKLINLKKKYINNENLKIIPLDLTEDNFDELLYEKLKEINIFPDFLINNARSAENLKIDPNGIVSDKAFMHEFYLNVLVPYKLIMMLIKRYPNKLKSIINISSIYGSVVPNLKLYKNPETESPIHYGISKAALEKMTKEMAVRLSRQKIRVNCVSYGGVEGRVDEKFKKKYSELSPAGRMLKDEDLTSPVEMLLNDENKAINGHVLMVDDGWTLW